MNGALIPYWLYKYNVKYVPGVYVMTPNNPHAIACALIL